MMKTRWRRAVGAAALALLYYIGARAGLLMAIENTNATPVWPPAGIAMAGLLLFGWRAWPGVWLGAFAANMVVFSQNQVAPQATIVGLSAVIAIGNTLEALVGWWLCSLRAKVDENGSMRPGERLLFGRGMGVFWFASSAVIAGAISASIGPAAVCAANIAPWDQYQRIVLTWWGGDATGILYVTPFLFCFVRRSRASWQASGRLFQLSGMAGKKRWWPSRRRLLLWGETLAAFTVLLVACVIVMSGIFVGPKNLPVLTGLVLKFIIIAPLMWIAVRVGLRGTATGLMVMAAFFVWHARRHFGELDAVSENNAILFWLAFLWVVGVSSMTLANFVAAHRESLDSLRETNAALQATMDAIPAMVCVAHDPQCHHITGNARAHEVLRVPLGDNLSKTPPADAEPPRYEVRINGEDRPMKELAMQKAAATGKAVVGQEQELTFANGDARIIIYGNAVPVLDEKGAARGCVAAFVDVTELKRAKDDLAAMNERLEERVTERTERLVAANTELAREYAERHRLEDEMTQISERERLTLGQNLHDGVCQHLSGVAFMASTLAADVRGKGLAEEAEKLDELTQLIREATQQARDVARGLHPVEVDAEGLVAALRHLASSSTVEGLRCSLHCPRSVPVRDNSAAMHLYRIAQEAVVNATKHAQAAEIIISLDVNDKNIVLSVADDGVGLPADLDRSRGLGLRMMRHRAGVIGGTFSIESPPEGGTMVTCVLPVMPLAESA